MERWIFRGRMLRATEARSFWGVGVQGWGILVVRVGS